MRPAIQAFGLVARSMSLTRMGKTGSMFLHSSTTEAHLGSYNYDHARRRSDADRPLLRTHQNARGRRGAGQFFAISSGLLHQARRPQDGADAPRAPPSLVASARDGRYSHSRRRRVGALHGLASAVLRGGPAANRPCLRGFGPDRRTAAYHRRPGIFDLGGTGRHAVSGFACARFQSVG